MSDILRHGWFSAKSVFQKASTLPSLMEGRGPLAFWYRKEDGGDALVTEVTMQDKYTSNFDDFEHVGKISRWIRDATDDEALAAAAEKRKK